MQKELKLYLDGEQAEDCADKLGDGFDEDERKERYSVKSLRGFLQHRGEVVVTTEELCRPVEY